MSEAKQITMDHDDAVAYLECLRVERYPLGVNKYEATAFVLCINRIMAAVPFDQQPRIRADYDLLVSTLLHPDAEDDKRREELHRSLEQIQNDMDKYWPKEPYRPE